MEDSLKARVLLEQYKHFRNWIGEGQKQRDEATRFAILGNGALAAWVATADDVAMLAYFLPFGLTFALFLYWGGLRKKVLEGGAFVAILERYAGLDESSGAELQFRSRVNPESFGRVLRTRETPVWISLFLFSLLFPTVIGGEKVWVAIEELLRSWGLLTSSG